MTTVNTWSLQGTPTQNAIVAQALARCWFPFDLLALGLREQTGRQAIPVEWADLSRYGQELAEAEYFLAGAGVVAPRPPRAHSDSHDEFHVISFRRRALGLAWYSGKVSIEQSLESEPLLAQEVFLAEGAHMVDFFWVSADDRAAMFHAFHGGDESTHDHGWFEETGNHDYWSWVGESFMGGFMQAFSDLDPTLDGFVHVPTEEVGEAIRRVLLPYIGGARSSVFHDVHRGVRPATGWPARDLALGAGRRSCGVCRP